MSIAFKRSSKDPIFSVLTCVKWVKICKNICVTWGNRPCNFSVYADFSCEFLFLQNSLQEFDKDLHDALLLSKLEFEEKQRVSAVPDLLSLILLKLVFEMVIKMLVYILKAFCV